MILFIDLPAVQILPIILVYLTVVALLIKNRPFESFLENLIFIVNEICYAVILAFVGGIYILRNSWSESRKARLLGFPAIVVIGLLMVFNLVIGIWQVVEFVGLVKKAMDFITKRKGATNRVGDVNGPKTVKNGGNGRMAENGFSGVEVGGDDPFVGVGDERVASVGVEPARQSIMAQINSRASGGSRRNIGVAGRQNRRGSRRRGSKRRKKSLNRPSGASIGKKTPQKSKFSKGPSGFKNNLQSMEGSIGDLLAPNNAQDTQKRELSFAGKPNFRKFCKFFLELRNSQKRGNELNISISHSRDAGEAVGSIPGSQKNLRRKKYRHNRSRKKRRKMRDSSNIGGNIAHPVVPRDELMGAQMSADFGRGRRVLNYASHSCFRV